MKEKKIIQSVTQILERMKEFCHFEKNMFLSIREGIAGAKKDLGRLRRCNASHESFLSSLEYFRSMQVAKDKGKECEEAGKEECHTDLGPRSKSPPDFRMWLRKSTVNPQETSI